MAMPAPKFTPEKPVEECVARIETHTENMQSGMSEMKSDIRGLRAEMRELGSRMHAMELRLFGALAEFKLETERRFASIEQKISENTRWIIGVMVTVAIAMAGGFFWLAERIAALQMQLTH